MTKTTNMTNPLKMTVAQLREELTTRGLDSSGLKPALVSRLQEAMEGKAGAGAAGAAGEKEEDERNIDQRVITTYTHYTRERKRRE